MYINEPVCGQLNRILEKNLSSKKQQAPTKVSPRDEGEDKNRLRLRDKERRKPGDGVASLP